MYNHHHELPVSIHLLVAALQQVVHLLQPFESLLALHQVEEAGINVTVQTKLLIKSLVVKKFKLFQTVIVLSWCLFYVQIKKMGKVSHKIMFFHIVKSINLNGNFNIIIHLNHGCFFSPSPHSKEYNKRDMFWIIT